MILKLKSSDGKILSIDEKVAKASSVFREMLEVSADFPGDEEPFPCNCDSDTLAKVIEWMKHHKDDEEIDDKDENEIREMELDEWDQQFFSVEKHVLFALLRAANYLNINNLLQYTAKVVARNLEGKTTEEMREYMGIENDLTDGNPIENFKDLYLKKGEESESGDLSFEEDYEMVGTPSEDEDN